MLGLKSCDYSWRLPWDQQLINFGVCTTQQVAVATVATGLYLFSIESQDWTPGLLASLMTGTSLNTIRKFTHIKKHKNQEPSFALCMVDFALFIGAIYYGTSKALRWLDYQVSVIEIARLGCISTTGILIFNGAILPMIY